MKQLKSISKNVHPLKAALQKCSLDEFLYVPIDVAKFSHTASAVDFFGDVVRQPFAFANSRKGVKFFLKELRKTMRLRKVRAVFVGLEASGQYHELLTLALRECGLDVAVINPLDSWRERENPHAKNDRIDLGPIARVIIANKGSRSKVPEGVYYQLFRAARTRRKYVSIRAACKNRITSVVDRLFPGYWTHDDPLFSDRWGKASVLTLRHYPTPQQLIKLGVKRLGRFLTNHNTKLGLPKARKIVERARDALRRPLEDLQVDRLVLSRFLNDYDNACGAIAELEPHIVRLLIQTPGVATLSVPGIGLAHAGDFTGLLGDISRFAHYSQVISFAGHPSKTKDSGQWQSDGGAMSKKGNPQFRTVLNQIALSLNTYCEDCERRLKSAAGGGRRARRQG